MKVYAIVDITVGCKVSGYGSCVPSWDHATLQKICNSLNKDLLEVRYVVG